MARIVDEFLTPAFKAKIAEVRDMEASRNHQSEMYKKPLQSKRKKVLKELISKYSKNKHFIEVGCAEGYFCNYALKQNALSSTGVEIAEKKIKIAQKRFPKCIFKKLDIFDVETLEHKYDIVLCSEVLQHLVDYETAILKLIEIIHPRGYLIISVPNLSNSDRHKFAKISAEMGPYELLQEIGGARFGRQNALWKFNSLKLSEEIVQNYPLSLIDRRKIGAAPLENQTKEQAKNIFTILIFKHFSSKSHSI